MDEIHTGPSASHEMAQRIRILKRRISGYDREQIEKAEGVLSNARAELALDERLLAEWQDIAIRSA